MSNLFELADKQGNSLSKIMDGVHTVMDQLPQIKGLKKEVHNFIMQLPAGGNSVSIIYWDWDIIYYFPLVRLCTDTFCRVYIKNKCRFLVKYFYNK